jgi:hypothetical protein
MVGVLTALIGMDYSALVLQTIAHKELNGLETFAKQLIRNVNQEHTGQVAYAPPFHHNAQLN